MTWPVMWQFLPDIFMLSSKIKVNLSYVLPGCTLIINWKGIPVFIKNRTLTEINLSRLTKINDLKDKLARNENLKSNALAFDRNRCINRLSTNWLVLLAPCTHLGCIPEIKNCGWYCSCHGSIYDNVGRILKGPAPYNLKIPKCSIKLNYLTIGD